MKLSNVENMVQKKEYQKDVDLQGEILEKIAGLSTPGFFLTAEFSRNGENLPSGIETFISGKLDVIRAGSEVRKFVFQAEGWRIIFTFFPADRVVDERYALKNKMFRH